MSKIGVIVSGGTIGDEFAIEMIQKIQPNEIIGVDRGIEFLYRNQIMPTFVVGDFDSVSEGVIDHYLREADVSVMQLNPIKDETDTESAVQVAIALEVDKIYILGATGTRLDHVWANVQTLKIALDSGVRAYILDECNRISLWEKEITLTPENQFGKYFSLFPLGEAVEDISIEGAKYPLSHYQMSPYESRCVSNELVGQDVKITFPEGTVILMETRD